jgi:hypothetical protein
MVGTEKPKRMHETSAVWICQSCLVKFSTLQRAKQQLVDFTVTTSQPRNLSSLLGKFCDNTKETRGIKAGGIGLSAYGTNTRNRARILHHRRGSPLLLADNLRCVVAINTFLKST